MLAGLGGAIAVGFHSGWIQERSRAWSVEGGMERLAGLASSVDVGFYADWVQDRVPVWGDRGRVERIQARRVALEERLGRLEQAPSEQAHRAAVARLEEARGLRSEIDRIRGAVDPARADLRRRLETAKVEEREAVAEGIVRLGREVAGLTALERRLETLLQDRLLPAERAALRVRVEEIRRRWVSEDAREVAVAERSLRGAERDLREALEQARRIRQAMAPVASEELRAVEREVERWLEQARGLLPLVEMAGRMEAAGRRARALAPRVERAEAEAEGAGMPEDRHVRTAERIGGLRALRMEIHAIVREIDQPRRVAVGMVREAERIEIESPVVARLRRTMEEAWEILSDIDGRNERLLTQAVEDNLVLIDEIRQALERDWRNLLDEGQASSEALQGIRRRVEATMARARAVQAGDLHPMHARLEEAGRRMEAFLTQATEDLDRAAAERSWREDGARLVETLEAWGLPLADEAGGGKMLAFRPPEGARSLLPPGVRHLVFLSLSEERPAPPGVHGSRTLAAVGLNIAWRDPASGDDRSIQAEQCRVTLPRASDGARLQDLSCMRVAVIVDDRRVEIPGGFHIDGLSRDGVQMLRVGGPARGNMRPQMEIVQQGEWSAAVEAFIRAARARP